MNAAADPTIDPAIARDAEAFRLHEEQKLTWREIAARYNVTERCLYQRMARLRERHAELASLRG